MRRLLILIGLLALLTVPVKAEQWEPPEAPPEAEEYMPEDTQSFSEGLWYVIKAGIKTLEPSLAEAGKACLSVMVVVMLLSLLEVYTGKLPPVTPLAGAVMVGLTLLAPSRSLIGLGTDTVRQLSEYGKLLLPVMSASLAAQGGVTASASLYAGTVLFDAILGSLVVKLIVPLLYVYLCLSIAAGGIGQQVLTTFKDFIKWLMTWTLKTILYVFTGYMGITGVVSGVTDAAAMKAAKLTISGMVPVVGGILSDASEAVLVSAGVMKNAAGVYGLIAIAAIWIGPFLRIGVQYLLLKLTTAVCSAMGTRQVCGLLKDFTGAMGILLAMTGAVGLMLLISTVSFMKGIG